MGEIVLDHVTKAFGPEVIAVNDVELTIGEGEFMVLVGPSGCGKTTLLRSIGGLEKITSGRIVIADRDVTRLEPAQRGLAMVFQNYALYPHMTLRENLGYGLPGPPPQRRGGKTPGPGPRARRGRRPGRAGRAHGGGGMRGREERLARRPGQLPGGQQQRVARGGAITREPAAFLMDEPLSNLDAKLRVTMRTSLQQLHLRLGTTTVYVTHDQVEAMTLGQRVSVMRDGKVQQVDAPQKLYDEPANTFVAAFIGSPAMNLAEGSIDGDCAVIGEFRIPLPRDRRPSNTNGDRVIVGIRPEAFEDPEFGQGDDPTIEAHVEVLEELGSDAHIFFPIAGKQVVIEDAVTDNADDEASLLAEHRDRAMFTARVDPRTRAQVGDTIRLAVDPTRLYFFSAETGESLLNGSSARIAS